MSDNQSTSSAFIFSDFIKEALTHTLDAQKDMVASGKENTDKMAFMEKNGKQVAKMARVAVKTDNGTKSLRLPVLTILPDTPMQINDAELNFSLDLDIEKAMSETKETTKKKTLVLPVTIVERRMTVQQRKRAISKFAHSKLLQHRAPGKIISRVGRKSASLLKESTSKGNSNTTENKKVDINATVKLSQAEMPYGISRLLQIAQGQGVRIFNKDTRQWVLITAKGDCCHKEGCRYIKGHTTERVVADDALLKTKRPCKVCKPLQQ